MSAFGIYRLMQQVLYYDTRYCVLGGYDIAAIQQQQQEQEKMACKSSVDRPHTEQR
jgi:hypothetical protein